MFLRGEVPSETQQQLAVKTVTDELGFDAVDQMRVTHTLWKQGEDEPKRGIEPREEPAVEEAQAVNPAETTDDVFTSEEDGVVFEPPTRPVPDDER